MVNKQFLLVFQGSGIGKMEDNLTSAETKAAFLQRFHAEIFFQAMKYKICRNKIYEK